MEPKKALAIVSKTWGGEKGFCFFPYIPGHARTKEERKQYFTQSDAYYWPKDRAKIVEFLEAHVNDDVYWYASLFEKPRPTKANALPETALWADLDDADPREFDHEYRPTIAWETSPDRFQAIWLVSAGDVSGASDYGDINHRLTSAVGADKAGWDTVQLLRFPGWINHKPDREQVPGQLLWSNGPRYAADDFDDLPEIEGGLRGSISDEIIEEELSEVDVKQVWKRVRLKVSKRVRAYMSRASGAVGAEDRSSILWQIERDLADAGCSVLEIIAIVRPTPWNKYAGRQEELHRLTVEATKAVDAAPEQQRKDKPGVEPLEESEDLPKPTAFVTLLAHAKPPSWLINQLWVKGACGFIGGEPKSHKSWFALDMALSVATGMPFLETFEVRTPGPVLYVQEEDAESLVKNRYRKIWRRKNPGTTLSGNGHGDQRTWEYVEDPFKANLRIAAAVGLGFTISDEAWQDWLDEVLTEGWEDEPYRLVIMDPLMMIAGDVEENRAQEMTTKVFKPAKLLARKHNTALAIVHHVRKKGREDTHTRGGQMLLGSVANHAWAESSIFITHESAGRLKVERENKHQHLEPFVVGNIQTKGWQPSVTLRGEPDVVTPEQVDRPTKDPTLQILRTLGGKATAYEIAEVLGVSPQTCHKRLNKLHARNLVNKTESGGAWPNKKITWSSR